MFDHFSLIAAWYDRLLGAPDTARLAALLRLPTPGVLLDLGGGTGRVSGQLRSLVDDIVVCDLSRKMLNESRKKHLEVVMGSASQLPFGRAAFDRVLLVDSFHHFSGHRAALSDIARVLKPGGILVVEEPDIRHPLVKFAAIAEKALGMKSVFYAPEVICSMLRDLGLQTKIYRDRRYTAWISAKHVG